MEALLIHTVDIAGENSLIICQKQSITNSVEIHGDLGKSLGTLAPNSRITLPTGMFLKGQSQCVYIIPSTFACWAEEMLSYSRPWK